MHVEQIGGGVDIMFTHQTGQRCSVSTPIVLTQLVGSGLVYPQRSHDIGRHFDFDLVKQPRLWWVERIIQIKDPLRDMAETVLKHL